jgi:uncharacterized protein YggE
MKKLLMIAVLAIFTTTAFSQNVDLRRKIEVTGSAESEVTPDIIYVSISLKEYMDGKKKVTIEQLERQLQKAVNDAGIAKEDFTISDVSAYNYTIEKKKNPDFLASKQYRLKVRELNRFNQILAGVDAKGVQSTNIESYDYSKIEQLKRELKVKALQAARDKATYLVTALGDKLGGAIEIQEINNESYPQPVYRANAMFKTMDAVAAPEENIDFKKIKLNYQMRTVFEIK